MSVLANLKHPNIIRLLEVHVANNCFYFIMEYASGGCLVSWGWDLGCSTSHSD